MILKASQRGGAGQLARHLLRTDENDHVEVLELRGSMSRDLRGAMNEAFAVSLGTKCKQFLFSLSLNPPQDGNATLDDLVNAIDRVEEKLGLGNNQRMIVVHEKNGRRHAHAVWCRIDPTTMKAVNLSHFKNKLADLSKQLYLDHGWELPEGHKARDQRNAMNFELRDWQQAKRHGLDPRQLKEMFRNAYANSYDFASFRLAVEEEGYFLARGDRRGLVAVGIGGDVHSVARLLGIKTKAMWERLGNRDQVLSLTPNVNGKDKDRADASARLPGVAELREDLKRRIPESVREALQATARQHRRELAPLRWKRRRMLREQKQARVKVGKANGAVRTVKGKGRGLFGRRKVGWLGTVLFAAAEIPYIRPQRAGESYEDYQRYRRELQRQFEDQQQERQALQKQIDETKARQRAERLTQIARIALLMRLQRDRPRRGKDRDEPPLTLEM